MEVWFLLVYAGATFLALQSLLSLITHHRKQYWNKLTLEHRQKSQSNQESKQKKTEETPDVAA